MFIATSGPSTLIGCENVPIAERMTSARVLGFDGDVLVFVRRNGTAFERFDRASL